MTPIFLINKTMLWNQILGHSADKGLWALHGKGMVEGMSDFSLDFDFYEHFIYGKHNWVGFPTSATTTKGIFKLIHNNVFGLVLVP